MIMTLNKNNLKLHKGEGHLCSWLPSLAQAGQEGLEIFEPDSLKRGVPWDVEPRVEALIDWIGSSGDKCINKQKPNHLIVASWIDIKF